MIVSKGYKVYAPLKFLTLGGPMYLNESNQKVQLILLKNLEMVDNGV